MVAEEKCAEERRIRVARMQGGKNKSEIVPVRMHSERYY